jgi:hypothetical protein
MTKLRSGIFTAITFAGNCTDLLFVYYIKKKN